jgi:hypothetical protein
MNNVNRRFLPQAGAAEMLGASAPTISPAQTASGGRNPLSIHSGAD